MKDYYCKNCFQLTELKCQTSIVEVADCIIFVLGNNGLKFDIVHDLELFKLQNLALSEKKKKFDINHYTT